MFKSRLAHQTKKGLFMWQPIEKAPKEQWKDTLVAYESGGQQFVHIAFWVGRSAEGEDPLPEDEIGWWSYVSSHGSQEMLDGHRKPTHWMPYSKPTGLMESILEHGGKEISEGKFEDAESVFQGLLEESESPWMPIETAPKDGTKVDLWADGERYTDCHWGVSDVPMGNSKDCEWEKSWLYLDCDNNGNYFYWPFRSNPSHWMIIPKGPEI